MIASVLATLLLALAAMAPGVMLCRGERLGAGGLAAAAAASLTVAMMMTALLGIAVELIAGSGLPALSLLPVSLALAAAAIWHSKGRGRHLPRLERPALLAAAFFVALGIVTHTLAVTELADGSLRIHAWYNADWFKHVGHSYGIADYGVPARDVFGNAQPLHYYWLGHVLPGAGTAVGGDAWAALYTANVIYGALIALTLYGLVRLAGARPAVAGLVTALATVICAPLVGWRALLSPGGVEAALMGVHAPTEPAFMSLALYIPQHTLALTVLLGWASLTLGDARPSPALRWLALGALATVMTISILFGAAILAAYGFTELFRRRLAALPELGAMAVLSGLLVLALGVIDLAGFASGDTLTSTARTEIPAGGALQRGFASVATPIANAGLPVFVCAYLAFRWKPANPSEADARLFAAALLVTVVVMAFLVEATVGNLIAHEVRLRVTNLLAVACGVVGGWAFQHGWSAGGKARTWALAMLAALVVAAAPTIAIRTLWHVNDRDRFATTVPADDLAVLAVLHRESGARDVVWQFPVNSFLSIPSGVDSWSVVFAGRTNIATSRATNRSDLGADFDRARRYFAGEDVPVPAAADWIYLSRSLHPASYDRLVARLDSDQQWSKAGCRADACLFRRAPTS